MRCGLTGSMCCIVKRYLTLTLSQRERGLKAKADLRNDTGLYSEGLLTFAKSSKAVRHGACAGNAKKLSLSNDSRAG